METFLGPAGIPARPLRISPSAKTPLSELRGAILMLAETAGMTPSAMRQVICGVLLVTARPEQLDRKAEYLARGRVAHGRMLRGTKSTTSPKPSMPSWP